MFERSQSLCDNTGKLEGLIYQIKTSLCGLRIGSNERLDIYVLKTTCARSYCLAVVTFHAKCHNLHRIHRSSNIQVQTRLLCQFHK